MSPEYGPDTAHWELVIDQLPGLGVRNLHLSGGEPLLRRDLPILITKAKRLGLTVQILTNGLLLRGRLFEECISSGLDWVTVSIDTLDAANFEMLRGTDLRRVLAGVRRAIELRSIRKGFHVGVKCVISRLNIPDLPALIDWALLHELYLAFQPFHARFAGRDEAINNLTCGPEYEPVLTSALNRILDVKRTSGLFINQEAYLHHFPRFLVHGDLPGGYSCQAGEETINIDTKLNVRPCWLLPPAGNLERELLASIWNSPDFIHTRNLMRTTRCCGCWLTCHADVRN